jgi:hypothetical protein
MPASFYLDLVFVWDGYAGVILLGLGICMGWIKAARSKRKNIDYHKSKLRTFYSIPQTLT